MRKPLVTRVLTTILGVLSVTFITPAHAADPPKVTITGETLAWHTIMFTIDGPEVAEDGESNPFRDYRMDVRFERRLEPGRVTIQANTVVSVPGYFAADGNAAESGATTGNKWRANFVVLNRPGTWNYQVVIRRGKDIAISADPDAGEIVLDEKGQFEVAPPARPIDDSTDARRRGLLYHVRGERYLQWTGTHQYFLKCGADSPENLLGYADFDGTYRDGKLKQRKGENFADGLHHFEPHVRDWKEGDPTWQGGKGKGIIGALNYLASVGGNSVYFLTMNVDGDGKDVWPWISPDAKDRDRFDCSKLDQWDIVFDHMDKLGIQLHVVTQEQENDQLLDGGELGDTRKLYYRELIARFAHHRALVWNLGEENTNTDAQRKAFCDYIHALDPYDHPVVCHTFPNQHDKVYTPLLGYPTFEGLSIQTDADVTGIHALTMKWIKRSIDAGRPWCVFIDEPGSAAKGVTDDGAKDNNYDEMRRHALWGNLMAGGSGVEWYFGYKYPHNDLNCEDWRSRAELWKQTHAAVSFFQQHLPFAEMHPADGLTEARDDYVFIQPGEVYCVYLPDMAASRTVTLDLPDASYDVQWYNPREGGALTDGTIARAHGPGAIDLGRPKSDDARDWVALLKLHGDAPTSLPASHTQPQWGETASQK
ncbi:MAG: DUF5060 domain-containing protein [Phycisphaera sp.]|nr:DUF5060 domain-containing protein [Phycisphaera sp.]